MNNLRISTLSLTIVLFTAGALILPVNTASAHCKGNQKKDPQCETHDHDEPSGGEKAEFSVLVSGLSITSGNSLSDHPWWTGSKHGIGESDPHEEKVALEKFDASYFADNITNGADCFGASTSVQEASIRKRRGAMESMFWFRGRTNDDFEDVTYILHMGGPLIAGGEFPPASLGAISTMAMDHWRINVANGQSDVEPFACDASSGDFPTPVFIDVKAET